MGRDNGVGNKPKRGDILFEWAKPEDYERFKRDWGSYRAEYRNEMYMKGFFERGCVYVARERKTGSIVGYRILEGERTYGLDVKPEYRGWISRELFRRSIEEHFKKNPNLLRIVSGVHSEEGRQKALERFNKMMGGKKLPKRTFGSPQFEFRRSDFIRKREPRR